MGVRGCGTIATLDFNREQDWGQSIAWLNEQTLVVAQVESLPAVETLDDTLRVTGIDAIVVGPLDLSISLGVPGQFSHPRMIETIDRVIATCRAHRVPSGIVMGTPQDLKPWWDKGMRFLVCGNDLTVLQSTARAYVNTVRAYVGSE
jgi:2-dehydro-3-deoxyglucarate aldolase/4-hydroxy-2-oxoheptanedioate aldolase